LNARKQRNILEVPVFHLPENRFDLLGWFYGSDCSNSETAGRLG